MILGLFVLALGERRSPAASLIGLAVGLVATAAVVLLGSLEGADGAPLLEIGWPWRGLITCACTVTAGGVVRMVFERDRPGR